MRLWELSPRVAGALRRHFESLADVEVFERDGYRGVSGLSRADFVLVDPVVLEEEPVAALLGRLTERGIPFLCWLPRRGGVEGREDDASRRFRTVMESSYGVTTVRWRPWASGMCGCQLIVPRSLEPEASSVTEALKLVTGWSD